VTELITRKAIPRIDWTGVPARYVGKASAVCRTLAECSELVRWFGDATFYPFLPVLVKAPGGWTAITGWGYADAAELQDCAVVLWHRQTLALEATGRLMDFDDLRERNGLMRREELSAAVGDAIDRKIANHKASPVTNPFRQPSYPRPNGRTLHTVAKEQVNGSEN
jgi:hypothetical protein